MRMDGVGALSGLSYPPPHRLRLLEGYTGSIVLPHLQLLCPNSAKKAECVCRECVASAMS
jgi:hypothetical protein